MLAIISSHVFGPSWPQHVQMQNLRCNATHRHVTYGLSALSSTSSSSDHVLVFSWMCTLCRPGKYYRRLRGLAYSALPTNKVGRCWWHQYQLKSRNYLASLLTPNTIFSSQCQVFLPANALLNVEQLARRHSHANLYVLLNRR